MIERQTSIAFIEGPQGAGKTTATKYAETLGFRTARGIPTGNRLIANTEAENWAESLSILNCLISDRIPTVTDRSLWSLIVFNMRRKPDSAELVYKLGSSLIRRRLNGTNNKTLIILSPAATCISRANPNSPVSITDLNEENEEVKTYANLLERLKTDGFNTLSISNTGITKKEFLEQVKEALSD